VIGRGIKPGDNLVDEFTPDSFLTSEILIEQIEGWVDTLRTEMFGSPDKPFASIDKAEEWIRAQAKAQPKPSDAAIKEYETYRKAWDLLKPSYEWFNASIRPMEYPTLLLYKDHTYQASRSVYITENPPPDWTFPQDRPDYKNYSALNWLENETRMMAKGTGFDQPCLIALALCGIKPVLRRTRVCLESSYKRTPDGKNLYFNKTSVDLLSRDIETKDLQYIYSEYRKNLNIKQGQTYNQTHWDLYRLVKDAGGVPKKGKTAFWKELKQILNENYNSNYTTWEGVKRKYERILIQIQRQRGDAQQENK
jgi:hypothetical protein